jgi:hypothetical protein
MRRSARFVPLALLGLCACQTNALRPADGRLPTVELEEPERWRSDATPDDAKALDGLPALWSQALGEARGRYGRAVAGERALLAPDAALARAAPAPGPYRCRAIRLGARTAAARPWAVSRSGFCFVGVADGQLSFTSELPGDRIAGYLWDQKDDRRLVFLGAAAPPRARSAPAYGAAAGSDRVGVIERTGEFRYRLVLPARSGDARLIVIELLAAPAA